MRATVNRETWITIKLHARARRLSIGEVLDELVAEAAALPHLCGELAAEWGERSSDQVYRDLNNEKAGRAGE